MHEYNDLSYLYEEFFGKGNPIEQTSKLITKTPLYDYIDFYGIKYQVVHVLFLFQCNQKKT